MVFLLSPRPDVAGGPIVGDMVNPYYQVVASYMTVKDGSRIRRRIRRWTGHSNRSTLNDAATFLSGGRGNVGRSKKATVLGDHNLGLFVFRQ